MVNQQMIDSWQRGQDAYTQARYFTPGEKQTAYITTERGRPRRMDLLVVVHNDVPATNAGLQRVDLIVNSGRFNRPADHGNGHLVNTYDEQVGITDHTALYTDTEMAGIHQGSGTGPVLIQDRDGGGPLVPRSTACGHWCGPTSTTSSSLTRRHRSVPAWERGGIRCMTSRRV